MLLYNLHITAFIIHLCSTLASFYFHIDEASRNVVVPLHEYRKNVFTQSDVTALFTLNAIVLVTLNEALTCFSHGIALWVLSSNNSKKEINNLELNRRTIEYCATAGILQCALVLHVGDVQLHDLIFLLVINVVIQLLGISIDMMKEFGGEQGINWFYGMAFSLLFSEIIYVLIHCLNIHHPNNFSMGFFIFMGVVYGILYLTFGFVKFISDAYKANEIYVLLSVTTKIILSWIVIGNTHYGFTQLFDKKYLPEGIVEADWESIMTTGSVALLAITAGFTILILNREDEDKRKKDDDLPDRDSYEIVPITPVTKNVLRL